MQPTLADVDELQQSILAGFGGSGTSTSSFPLGPQPFHFQFEPMADQSSAVPGR